MKSVGRYTFSLSPHQPLEIESADIEESSQFVDFLEEPRPYSGHQPDTFSVVFVDGVRRTECVAYIKDEETGESFEGAFVSVGAGALKVDYGRLNLVGDSLLHQKVERILFFRGSATLETLLGFKPKQTDREITQEVNRYMKEELETRLALRAFKESSDALVVCDGTLSYKLRHTSCLGFVKSIKRLYMDRVNLNLLYSLKVGQRSPILKVHYQRQQEEEEKVDKYTWYIKLSPHEGLHGLARVEVFPQNIDLVKRLADLSAGVLPLFASQSFQDRRSPQNLLPIGSLEKFLRLNLGAYGLIRRKIEDFFHA
ncbi:MAG: DNA double-strand break repair nuclease NurA [Aquificaceae bacterium]|nr:DNA double-strand break repair nuclease NurA [Aquificaceae bacterium]MCX8060837.1 DNA double-strand break repair nuclease NurA [Aquificaceae bacterium]MDW8096730.1 DNA double-strand break repair nuclease NurA [Aquificaceae bacterium]